MSRHHDFTFPGESPEYREARDRLLEAEMELRRKIEEVAAQRRALPPGGEVSEDYVFEEVLPATGETRAVRLSELFDKGKDDLLLYGFMYGPDWSAPCPMCTSMTDGSNGIAPHLRQATNFAVVAKAPPEKLATLARDRGWQNLRLLSSQGNSFNRDYFSQYEGSYGEHHPIMNVFQRDNGKVRHFWASELFWVAEEGMQPRHVDQVWPLWSFLDMTRGGRGDFTPKLHY